MRNSTYSLTQSKYYSPVFNAAIFDGPFRIYFAQAQEATALKIYFGLKDELEQFYERGKKIFKNKGHNIFVMLYPDEEGFEMAFQDSESLLTLKSLESDYVLGVKNAQDEKTQNLIYEQMKQVVDQWDRAEPLTSREPTPVELA